MDSSGLDQSNSHILMTVRRRLSYQPDVAHELVESVCKFSRTTVWISLGDIVLVLLREKVVHQLRRMQQTLQTRIHIAGVSNIHQSHLARMPPQSTLQMHT